MQRLETGIQLFPKARLLQQRIPEFQKLLG